MNRRTVAFTVISAIFFVAWPLLCGAAKTAIYPESKVDEKGTREARLFTSAMGKGLQMTFYLTSDSFDKVIAYYKKIGKLYKRPGAKKNIQTLSAGQTQIKEACFILDKALDLKSSKLWVKIQHPVFDIAHIGKPGQDKGMGNVQQRIRNITRITVSEKVVEQTAPKK